MSPIAGISSKDHNGIVHQVVSMLDVMQPNTTSSVWSIIDSQPANPSQGAGVKQTLGQLSFLLGAKTPEQPHFDSSGEAGLLYEGELYNSEEAPVRLRPRRGLPEANSSELVTSLLRNQQGALKTKIRPVLEILDGSYVLVAKEDGQTVIVRDSLGTRPVYLAYNDSLVAFASNKKPLWQIGMDDVFPLRAGTMAIINEEDVEIDRALPLTCWETEIREISEAVECYQKALFTAVEKRLNDVDEVGILLSGGVDSCLLAKLLSDIAVEKGVKVIAYTVGVHGSQDMGNAQAFAQEMGLDCRIRELDFSDVDTYTSEVIEAVEERDFVQVEAGVGIYAAVEMAAHDGIKIVFSGQGPDELWGGYEWYPKV